jgi:hypothetical protein
MQDSLPAGWLAFTGRESNPLDRDERFPSGYISSSSPGFILTLQRNNFGSYPGVQETWRAARHHPALDPFQTKLPFHKSPSAGV